MESVNQITPGQIAGLAESIRKFMSQWRNCTRLAWGQVELGGYSYIEPTKLYDLEGAGYLDSPTVGVTFHSLHP